MSFRYNNGSTKTPIVTKSVTISGATYRGNKTIPADYKPNGSFVSVKNATLDKRLDLPLNATEVTTVL
jgi:hypothetical protein